MSARSASPPLRDLVHAERFDPVQIAVPEPVGDDPLHAPADRIPLHAEAFGVLFPAQALRPRGQEVPEHVALAVLAVGPRHPLDLDPATRAIHTPHRVGQGHRDVQDRHERELPGFGHAVVAGTRFAAARAYGFAAPPAPHFGDDARIDGASDHLDSRVNETLDLMDLVQ